MKQGNKRNTAKEKAKENKHFPYRTLVNQKKYRVVDNSGKSYGEFRLRSNALKEIEILSKELFIEDLMLESLR